MIKLVRCQDPLLICLLRIYGRIHALRLPFKLSLEFPVIPQKSELNISKGPWILATRQVYAEREENGNMISERHGCGIDMPLSDPAIRKERAAEVDTSHKTDEMSGLYLDTPLADIWADPCIEFAIKTLTGAIPVEYDLENQDYFQHRPSSLLTQSQSGNHSSMPGIGIDNLSHTDFICQQYDVTEKSMSNEHIIINPIFNYTHSGKRP